MDRKPTKKQIDNINIDNLPENFVDWYIYRKGFYDFDFFVNYHLIHYKQDKKTGTPIEDAKIHKSLRKHLLENLDLLVVFPRNHAKSTNSFFVLIWLICYKQEKHIGLIMGESLGVETIGKIRDEFETNEKIIRVFGRLVPNKSQTEANKKRTHKQLDFLNGVKIEAITMKGKIRGKRFTRIIIDDPQEDKDVRNIVISDAFIRWFFSTVYPVLDPTGNCIVIGTNIGELCFVNFLIKEKRGFTVLEYKAIENPEYEIQEDGKKHLIGGEPLRIEKRPIHLLDKMLQTIGRKIFQQEYMNEPNTMIGSPIFNIEIIEKLPKIEFTTDKRYSHLRIYKDPCQCSWGIDLSMGGTKGDFSTIYARDQEYNIVFVYQGRVLRYELIDVIDYLDGLGYVGTKVFERNLGTAQAIFDVAQDKIRFNDIYTQKTIGQVNERETLNLGRHTNKQNKEKMIAEMQILCEGYIDEGGVEHKITEIDEREKTEMKFFVFDEKGRMNAMPGHHDDLIIADALCIQGMKDMYGFDVESVIL